ncbi:hypothetical protein [Porphyrobacter sp. YT40]|uniref:hypothetical protein n=1 Tax=Porphyrobacter sp. YT40 TaxID=2547601 RepID=UPI0015E87D2F|nr:hypothetical protein [Porphyrobacter sp. YT40]
MDKRFWALPLLLVAGQSLSGCVAAAIPALAGAGVFGTRIDGKDAGESGAEAVASVPAPAPAPVPGPTPTPAPTTVRIPALPATPAPAPAPAPSRPASQPAPSLAVAVPPPATSAPPAARPAVPAPTPAATTPPPVTVVPAPVQAAPVQVGPRPAPAPTAPSPQLPPAGAVAAPAAATAAAPVAVPPMAAYPDPARPLTPEQSSFARFVRYGQASALGGKRGADLPSAILSDPVALDGQRRRCSPGEQPVAVIDLDPAGGVFSPPVSPAPQPGLALGLAVLREAGVEIAWLSDMPTTQSGALRVALEKSGLDPRGEDIISLRRDGADTKDQRRESLAAITCIIAIAGDERPDFDTRFKYLRSPEAGAGLEPLIGDGWFLIAPLLGE